MLALYSRIKALNQRWFVFLHCPGRTCGDTQKPGTKSSLPLPDPPIYRRCLEAEASGIGGLLLGPAQTRGGEPKLGIQFEATRPVRIAS
jgi:hypothetical protein